MPDSTSDAATDAPEDGATDDPFDGSTDEPADGNTDDANTDGSTDGNSDASTDRGRDGNSDGNSDASSDGNSDASTDRGGDGNSDGNSDANTDGLESCTDHPDCGPSEVCFGNVCSELSCLGLGDGICQLLLSDDRAYCASSGYCRVAECLNDGHCPGPEACNESTKTCWGECESNSDCGFAQACSGAPRTGEPTCYLVCNALSSCDCLLGGTCSVETIPGTYAPIDGLMCLLGQSGVCVP